MSESTIRIADFPYPVLSPICPTGSKPTYLTLRTAQLQLNMNAKSVHTHRGGGAFGHLVLTMTPAKYLTITALPFVIPVPPTLNPVHAAGATGPAITETNRQHAAAQKEYATFIAVENALRSQLIAAVPYKYIQVLSDPDVSFGNTPVLAIITHLMATYGKITHADLTDNAERMNAPWNPDDGIDVLFAQLKLGREFAAAGNDPISEISTVQIGYHGIEKTGKFETACREWRMTPTADKTYANFETRFRLADEDYSRTATSRSAGYHRANAGTTNNAPPKPAVPTQAPAPTPAPRANTGPGPIISYCWTHGLLRTSAEKHSSKNCNFKKEGHQDDATLTNQMGGKADAWQRRPANQG
jgi:hypothetical protein